MKKVDVINVTKRLKFAARMLLEHAKTSEFVTKKYTTRITIANGILAIDSFFKKAKLSIAMSYDSFLSSFNSSGISLIIVSI